MSTVEWDKINKGTGVVISGLQATVPNDTNTARANLGRSSGKWYWEITISAGASFMIGISDDSAGVGRTYNANGAVYYGYFAGISSKGVYNRYSYGESYKTGDVLSILIDFNNGNIEFWKNGISQGIALQDDIRKLGTIYPAVTESGGQSQVTTANFGASPFKYKMPLGYYSYDGSQFSAYNKFLISSGDGEAYSITPEINKAETAIPKMTSNTNPSGRAFAETVYSTGYEEWKAFNRVDDGEGYLTKSGNIAGYLGFEFPEKIIISKYAVRSMLSPSFLTSMPKNWTFEGSNDGVTWIALDTQINQTWTTVSTDINYNITNRQPFKMYRLKWTTNNGYANYTDVNELKMFEYIPSKLTNLESTTEDNFIKYGMDSSLNLSFYDGEVNVRSSNSVLGSGKTFEHTVDLGKRKVNKIVLN